MDIQFWFNESFHYKVMKILSISDNATVHIFLFYFIPFIFSSIFQFVLNFDGRVMNFSVLGIKQNFCPATSMFLTEHCLLFVITPAKFFVRFTSFCIIIQVNRPIKTFSLHFNKFYFRFYYFILKENSFHYF